MENYSLNNLRDGEPIVGQRPNGIDVTTGFNGSKYYLVFVLFIFVMFGLLISNILNIILLLVCYTAFIGILICLYNSKKNRCSLKLVSEVVYVTKKIVSGKDGRKKCWNVFYAFIYNGQVYYFSNLIPLKNDYPDIGSRKEIFVNIDNPKEGMMFEIDLKAIKNIIIISMFWLVIFGLFAILV